ncbi:MAG TPA: response regulator transcription factor [Symbiobacteriaceae bacterium]|nr:response regulator transcription factor [Symbiobacteriaceae bacterium]
MSIRVVLVDDTRMFRDGLRLVIDMEEGMSVVGVASNGAEGVEAVGREQPDVVLMDIRMPELDGVEATRRIKAKWPQTHVIILTTYSDDEFIFEALKAGAVGYMVKDLPASELVQAIRTVQQGGALIPPAIAARLVAEFTRLAASGAPLTPPPAAEPARSRVADLTQRETEILGLVARGLSNKEIADSLYLSEGTVKNYVSAIFAKLHARDRAQAIALAHRQGLVD